MATWPITFLLANLEGTNTSQNPDCPKREEERFRLISPFLQRNTDTSPAADIADIVLLSELTLRTKLERFGDYHQILERKKQRSQTGMFLKKTKFEVPKSFTEEKLRSCFPSTADPHDFDDFMDEIKQGTMCIRKATLTNRNDSILLVFISWSKYFRYRKRKR